MRSRLTAGRPPLVGDNVGSNPIFKLFKHMEYGMNGSSPGCNPVSTDTLGSIPRYFTNTPHRSVRLVEMSKTGYPNDQRVENIRWLWFPLKDLTPSLAEYITADISMFASSGFEPAGRFSNRVDDPVDQPTPYTGREYKPVNLTRMRP